MCAAIATLLLFALLSGGGGVRGALVCPRFTDIALSQQPIVAGNDCADNKPLPGTCELTGFGLRCATIDLFASDTTTSAIPSGLLCFANECTSDNGAACSCAGNNLCIRTVSGAQAPFTCIEDNRPTTTTGPAATTTATTTAAAPVANFCDEDDDFETDCSQPKDDTVVFLVVFFASIASLIACAACLTSRGPRQTLD
jgi:hypothetical protein